MSWHWGLGEQMEVELCFPWKVKCCQVQRQSVYGGKYLWERRSWAQRCWAWSRLFPSCDVLLMVTRPCPSLTPVKDNIHGCNPAKTFGRFFTSSCLLFSLNLLIRGGPYVSERWRLVTPKAVAAYQQKVVIRHFLPWKCTKTQAGLSPELWAGDFCSSQPAGIPLEMCRSHLGLLGFLLAPKLMCFLEKCCGWSGI